MINMSLNSDFYALSNEGLLVKIFEVVPKLEGWLLKPPPPVSTNHTKIGQAAEG